MKKRFATRRFGSLLLALVLVLSMGLTAMADTVSGTVSSSGQTGTIIISNPQENTTYYAYKIFDVTYSYNYSYDSDEGNEESAKSEAAGDETIPNYAYYISTTSQWFGYISGRDSGSSTYESSYTNSALGITLTQSAANASIYYVTRVEVSSDDDESSSYISAATLAKLLKNFVFDEDDEVDSSIEAEAEKAYSSDSLNDDGSLTISDSLDLGYYLVIGVTTTTSDNGTGITVIEALAELTTTNPTSTINDKNEVEHNKSYKVLASYKNASGTTVEEDASTAGTVVDADSDDDEDETSVEIGSVLKYTIVETIPDATGFDKYQYEISDSMSQGLTLNNDVTISIYSNYGTDSEAVLTLTVGSADTDDDRNTYYPVTSGSGDSSVTYGTLYYTSKTFDQGTTEDTSDDVTITNNGFILTLDMTLLQNYVLYDLVITYTATVNEYASGTTLVNDATLTYNNDEGKHTITDQETAYSSRIVIDKYVLNSSDETDTNAKLAGAKFVLYRYKTTTNENGISTPVQVYGSDGSYYTDSAYTNEYTGDVVAVTSESTDGDGNATSTTTYYAIEYYCYTTETTTTDEDGNENTTPATVTWVDSYLTSSTDEDGNTTTSYVDGCVVTTNSDGAASFEGLTDGTYYLLEVEAPDGYNLLSTYVEVVVDGEPSENESGETVQKLVYTSSIANSTGTLLPSTGGIGTTVFYVAGIALIAGVVIVLIVRRRRNY